MQRFYLLPKYTSFLQNKLLKVKLHFKYPISETYKNRVHADIMLFIQNDLTNHLLKLRHKITGYLYSLNHSKEDN
jgi:hypothetical protein